MPLRRQVFERDSSRAGEENENVGQQQNEQQAQNQDLPPPPVSPVGQQVHVDAAQLMQEVNTLLRVVAQQQQDMRNEPRVIQIQCQVNMTNLTNDSTVGNETENVERGASKKRSYEPQGGKINLGKRPTEGVPTQDKEKRPFRQVRATNQSSKLKCCRCHGPHEVKDCKWLEGACYKCGKIGHVYKFCKEKAVFSQAFCFKCGQRGHKAMECKEFEEQVAASAQDDRVSSSPEQEHQP